MTNFDATIIVEGVFESSLSEYIEAVAHLIKTGLAWQLQGFFDRICIQCIESGYVSNEGEILIDISDFECDMDDDGDDDED